LTVRSIHQFVVGFDYGDAISNFTLELQSVIRDMGYRSEIYGKYISPEVRNKAHFYTEYDKESSSSNVVIFHFSIGSSVSQYFRSLKDRKVIVYHNITPAEFFDEFDSYVAASLREGRKELLELRDVVSLAVGVSMYDCRELEDHGFENVWYLPLVLNVEDKERGFDKGTVEQYSDGKINVLFVGRVVPNKKVEDLIKVFYFYKKYLNPRSRLIVVGGTGMWNKYYAFLQKLIDALHLKDVVFTEKVKDSELVGYYKVADVYLSMSEHEGFGLPLLEAMHFGVPVVAYSAAAIPETVGNGGILVDEKRYEKIAEIINEIVNNRNLHDYLVDAGRKRLMEFSKSRWRKRAGELIKQIERVVDKG